VKPNYIVTIFYSTDRMAMIPSETHFYGPYRFRWVAELVKWIMVQYHYYIVDNDDIDEMKIVGCVGDIDILVKQIKERTNVSNE